MPQAANPDLIVGSNAADDAGVYRLNETQALVVTCDFFPPIVDDPYMFGQIAAANALSDVYAMGGRPLVALNILCFPYGKIDDSIMVKLLTGGHDKVVEAGAVVAGGHSVKDSEMKYGLSVTGIVEINRIMANSTARTGDRLILTKALGTGIVSTAMKKDMAPDHLVECTVQQMAQLNRHASEVALKYRTSAITDITGFGLIGHTLEIAQGSCKAIRIDSESVPVIDGTADLAMKGCLTGGGNDNRKYAEACVKYETDLPESMIHVLHDPQTSGGLLIAIHPDDAESAIAEIRTEMTEAEIIGEVIDGTPGITII